MAGRWRAGLVAGFALAVLLCGACSQDTSLWNASPGAVSGEATGQVGDVAEGGAPSVQASPVLRPGLEGRVGVDVIFYKTHLDESLKTTPVHPNDAGFLTGATATEPDGYFDSVPSMAPMAGVFAGVGRPELRVLAGVYGRLNPLHFADEYRQGIYSARKQVSDVRSDNDGSFVFTHVAPGAFSLIPAVGVEAKVGGTVVAVEVGLPYTEWEVRSGHDRFADWETVQSESWSGFGIRYAGTVAFEPYDGMSFFVSGVYEKYDCDFGEISGAGVMAGVMWNW